MAGTLGDSKRRVRRLTGDTDPKDFAVTNERIEEMLSAGMQTLGNELGLGASWALAAISLAAGTTPADYSLPSTVQYAQVLEARIASGTRRVLEQKSVQWIEEARSGTDTPLTAEPVCYGMREDTAQLVTLMFYPEPDKAYSVDVLRSVIPTSLTSDTSAIPFSDPGLRALEKEVALTCVLSMTEEQRARRRISADVTEEWAEDIKNGVYWEKVRVARIKRSGSRDLAA